LPGLYFHDAHAVRKVWFLLVPLFLLLAAFAGDALPLRDTDAVGRVTEFAYDRVAISSA
jgi:hypothetical protein